MGLKNKLQWNLIRNLNIFIGENAFENVVCKIPTTLSRPQWVNGCTYIYIIISQNIRYLLWNRGFCRSLNNTYPIFLTPCIRCTNHSCDSCDLTDVNPHFIPSFSEKFKILTYCDVIDIYGPAATDSYCDVTMAHCSHGYLWTHDIEVGASWRDCDNPELFGTWLHHFAYRGRMIHYGTLGDQTIYTRFGLICFFTLLIIFGLPCFNTGHR